MRVTVGRLLGASVLAFFLTLTLPGCSGQQQGDDDSLDVSDNQAADNSADDNAATNDNNSDTADNSAGDDNSSAAADDSSGGDATADDGSTADDSGADATADASGGNGTENDLQGIIQEMNGQSSDGTAATADAGAQDSGDAQALGQNASAPAGNQAAAPAADNMAAAAPAAGMNSAAVAAPMTPSNSAATPAPAPAAQGDQQASTGAPMPFQPGGSPADVGLPELGSKMAYIVSQGDTLAKISQKIYGTASRWNELASLSGITHPSRIYPGDLVYYTLDEGAVAFAKAYEAIPRSEEQVKQGDTLASISQRIYGTSKAWRSIWRQNDKIDNPDVVTPGTTVFYVPKGAMSAAVQKVKAELTKLATQDKISSKTSLHNIALLTHKVSKSVFAHSRAITGLQLASCHVSNAFASYITNNAMLI